MKTITLENPFSGAGAFSVEETSSTMDEARRLARLGFPTGTIIMADRQTAGRGRLAGRAWNSAAGESLLATVILGREAANLAGFPIRVGLALARALSVYAIENGKTLTESPSIKWPNDILISGKKIAGILCEAAEGRTYVGIGVNLNQRSFPAELEGLATSLALASGLAEATSIRRERVLELILSNLAIVLGETDWKAEAEARLWSLGTERTFIAGRPEDGQRIYGSLVGIDETGSLLILRKDAEKPEAFAAGELSIEKAIPKNVDRVPS